ncbi:MAG: MBL fold metallo-hydrolase [Deltaproteobacteria bacterium]|nr:MBL fold metallo-hydrolase [Deltaproteobacteria bacterium]
MKITLLGTGTSTGVPVPGCHCRVCASEDPHNHRLRTSAFLELASTAEGTRPFSLLIDTSPDLRAQLLRSRIENVDAVLYTHNHADHTHGFDDLRPINFLHQTPIPAYCSSDTASKLRQSFAYAFSDESSYEGGMLPQVALRVVPPYEPFVLGGETIRPLPVMHGKMEIFGYRIGTFAYITDASLIPERSLGFLQGIDTLVLNALRERGHITHFTLESAVGMVELIQPRKTYFTHMSHEIEHEEGNAKIRAMSSLDIELGYDGLVITV